MVLAKGDKTAIIVGSAFVLFLVVLIIFELAYRLCVRRKRRQLFPKPKPVELPWFKAFKGETVSVADANPAWGRPSFVNTLESYQDANFAASPSSRKSRPSLGYIDVRRESLGGPAYRPSMNYIDVRRDSYLDADQLRHFDVVSPGSPQYITPTFLSPQSPSPSYAAMPARPPKYIEPVSPRSPSGVSYMEAVSSLRSPSAVAYMEAVGSPLPPPSNPSNPSNPSRGSHPALSRLSGDYLAPRPSMGGYLTAGAMPPSNHAMLGFAQGTPVHPSLVAPPHTAAALDEAMFQDDDRTFSAEAQARTWSLLNNGISDILSGSKEASASH